MIIECFDSSISESPTINDLVIIGSGPAGYTAAIYAARAELHPILIQGMQPGGQLMTTLEVENWPADVKGVQGPALMERFQEHAKRLGTKLCADQIIEVDLSKRPFLLTGTSTCYLTRSVIIATGAQANYLHIPGEQKYLGRGVSACATCDGFFFRDQDVVVLGGGNTAVEEVLYLSRICRHVTLIHRRDQLRAEKTLSQQLFAKSTLVDPNNNIDILWNHHAVEILGNDEQVTSVILASTVDGQLHTFPTAAVFVAIGHSPNTALFKQQLQMENGYIVTGQAQPELKTATSVAGVFACGDVSDSIYRQAITSAGSGCMAALDVEKYLSMYNQ